MSTPRPDIAAPHWLVQLLRSKPVPVPWNMVARAVVALAVPLAVAYAAGDIAVGALISTGALPAVLSESAGPYRYRARRLGGATLAATAGYAVGLLTGGVPALSVPAVILVAAVSALISAAGGRKCTRPIVATSSGCTRSASLWPFSSASPTPSARSMAGVARRTLPEASMTSIGPTALSMMALNTAFAGSDKSPICDEYRQAR